MSKPWNHKDNLVADVLESRADSMMDAAIRCQNNRDTNPLMANARVQYNPELGIILMLSPDTAKEVATAMKECAMRLRGVLHDITPGSLEEDATALVD